MEDFGDAFKKAKAAKRATLRELAKFTGKSIGYLSDVLHKRKDPPELETVARMEQCLDVKDNHLLILAKQQRSARPGDLIRRITSRPKLREALLRIENLSDDELDELGLILQRNIIRDGDLFGGD
jgi:transcriptional regulator with XRE-family HTH domain